MTVAFVEDRPPGRDAPPWIVTFSDMVSLLVTFFILLLTYSSVDDYDVFQLPVNILGRRGVVEPSRGRAVIAPPEADLESAVHAKHGSDFPHSRPQDQLAEELAVMGQKKTPDRSEVDFSRERDGLVVRFGVEASFAPGSAAVNTALSQALAELGRVLEHYPFVVVVEGFTDGGFAPTPSYATPEALSWARAVGAAHSLLAASELPPEAVQVAGLGARRPLNASATALERSANRRVEVRILPRTHKVESEGR